MGQAAVDLPDPLDDHANPAGAAGGDDLLSQLAGDEIDRLLAEGEEDQTLSSGRRAGEAEPTLDSVGTGEDAEAAGPSEKREKTTSETPEAIAAPEAADEPSEAAGLDALFTQIAAGERAPAPAEERERAQAEQSGGDGGEAGDADANIDAAGLDASLAGAAVTLPEEETGEEPGESAQHEPDGEAEGETSAAERMGLGVEAELAEAQEEELWEEAPLPLLLRPLVWLNAPLAFLPEPVRNAIGKVAIVTLFNALAVLAYVLIFRKH